VGRAAATGLEALPVGYSAAYEVSDASLAKKAIAMFLDIYSYRNLSQFSNSCRRLVKIVFDLSKFCPKMCGFLEFFGLQLEDALFLSVPEDLCHVDSSVFKRILVSLLDLSDEVLQCDRLIFCLSPNQLTVVKAFIYSGFEIVKFSNANKNYLFLGSAL
jgi:hypothetical protein